MTDMDTSTSVIDQYIASCPAEVQELLYSLRRIIKETVPEASEKMSYGMPTFALHGNLVHFAAFKNHIGFYPAPSGIENFREELSKYKSSKGAVQFPLDQPIPYELVQKMVRFRVAENIKQAEEKKKKK